MEEEIQLDDKPSMETQIYMMSRAINRLSKEITNQSERIQSNTNSTDEMKLLQREQNSNVSKIAERVGKVEKRQDAHDDWHGDEDEKTIKRLHEEEVAKALLDGKRKGVETVLGIEWRIAKWLFGGSFIAAGLAIGKLVNLIGLW